ncbi:hypothetical protein LNP00_04200 [Fructobacillus sp. M158]|uniref:hypothetical protein n=1 Tax=Fructobacillus parabroussonetiae TaxID=2713174 RepID=UPI00200A7138|nr:hypothetical protein [Fructobacillus parabroussonetiae]MCK8617565.1 hypothetical protein [Fructobacillus parabroussonetiae]
MTKKWFYLYDENTKEYIRAIRADSQPANTSAVDPAGVMFPVWSAGKGSWISDDKKLEEWNGRIANQNKQADPVQTQMAQMYQSFMQQQALANARDAKNEARIKALEEDLKGGKA